MTSEQEMLDMLIRWGQERDSVRAMVITSSRAVPNAAVDAFTDYDVILALTDIHPYFEDRGWLEAFGRVLVLYRDPILIEDGLEWSVYVTQYEDGLKIDFSLWPVEMLRRDVADPQLPDEFDAGYKVLLDKDGLTNGLKPPTYQAYIPRPPSEALYREMVELIFQEMTYVAKFLWRDDLVAAKHIMEIVVQDYLRPMLEWRMEIEQGWSVKPGPYGRRLKRWLRPDLWAELEAIYVGADLEENWDAMFRAAELFRKVAIEVGEKLEYSYPEELHQRAVVYLQKVRKLDRNAEQLK